MTRPSRPPPPSLRELGIPLLLAIAVLVAGPLRVGFLSDDYELLRIARDRSWVAPLEAHHWSLLMTFLYKATALGWTGRWAWQVLVAAAHSLNVVLFWDLTKYAGITSPWQRVVCASLFAVAAPGLEALSWAAALPYVILATIFLAAARYVLARDVNDAAPRIAWPLIALQALGLLVWDWAIVLVPILLALILLRPAPRSMRHRWRESIPLLGPAAIALLWTMAMLLGGQRVGYRVGFAPVRSAYFLGTAPLRALYPVAKASLFRSAVGIGASAVILLGLTAVARRNRMALAMTMVFFALQVPYAFFAAPESRYFYPALPFLLVAVILGVTSTMPDRFGVGVTAALLVFHAFWGLEGATLWAQASQTAQAIRADVDQLPSSGKGPLVLVDLPDRCGPADRVWRPFLWRNGLSAFARDIVRVNSGTASFTWNEGSGIPLLSANEVRLAHPGRPIWRFVSRAAEDCAGFEVVSVER